MTVALLQRQAVDGDVDARLVLADHHEEIGEESTATRLRDPHVGAHYAAALDRPDVMRLWRDEVPDREHRTRKRVDAMTDAESAQMAPWAKKWIEIGLCTKPADRVMFEAACRACYRLSGLPEPVSIVWADSPLVVAYAGPIAAWWIDTLTRRLDASVDASVRDSVGDSVRASVHASVDSSVRDSVRDSVHASVRDSVRDSVGASVRDSVDDSVRASVGDSVRDSVRDSVGASVGDSVHDSVGDSVGASVDASVGDSVRDSVGASVGDSVRDSVDASVRASVRDSVGASVRDKSRSKIATEIKKHFGNQWHNWFGGQLWVGGWYWYGDPSVTTFMLDVLRLQLDRQQELRARAYAATAMSACYWWPGRTHVIVSERPHTIEKRGDGRLKRIAWKGWEVAP